MIKKLVIALLAFSSVACTSDDVVSNAVTDVARQAPGNYLGIESIDYSDFPNLNTSENASVNVIYVDDNELSLIGQGGDAFTATVTGTSAGTPSLSEVLTAQGIYNGDNLDVTGSFRLTSDSTGTLTYTYTRDYDQGGTLTIEFSGTKS